MALEDPQKNIVCVFLIVNSYLNCLKVDRIQDNEEEKKKIMKGYLSPLTVPCGARGRGFFRSADSFL